MHYYQFNIGDYASHTSHLDEIEDLAYRRMLDYCYLNEIGLPESVEEIARLIRMRTHCKSIANVLQEFFYQDESGDWRSQRVEREISAYKQKSDKAKKAARKRWDNTYANALQTQSERNAKHKPITNNHKPVTKDKNTRTKALDYSVWPTMASPDVLESWISHRRAKKAQVSQTVVNTFGKELWKAFNAGYTVDQCLSECITRNWQGFKFEWLGGSYETRQRAGRETLSERANRAADEAFGTGSQSGILEGCFDVIDENGPSGIAGSGSLPDVGSWTVGHERGSD